MANTTTIDFPDAFQALTGNKPLSWQRRLFNDYFARDKLPAVIDLPTGLGKTMVMAIWLIARATQQSKIPTRLIYVVDRRTVVDQATDLAMKLVQRPIPRWMHDAFDGEPPAISTLRGQLADNREWSKDPTRPAIVIGTVDLIGSALLFSGYRSGYKYRPHEAGLLGMDSLLVLDEAHLSKPFEKLLASIKTFNNSSGTGILPVQPMQVIRMSATSGDDRGGTGVSPVMSGFNREECPICNHETVFRLCTNAHCKHHDLKPNPDPATGKERNRIVPRYCAGKTLHIRPDVDPKRLNDTIAEQAINLAERNDLKGKRLVVFIRRPDDARKIAEAICNHGGTKANPGPYAKSVKVLTGTMRGLERDELVKTEVLKRFLDGEEIPGENNDSVFLISTSAGEVGFDLNADHMVCDATTIDSFIQRLGRVNRRGYGDASVVLIIESEKKEKDEKKISDVNRAVGNTIKLLTDGMPLSPKSIATLKSGDWTTIDESESKSRYELACSPEPATVPLTDILLDNWSMTSIDGKMPGRPDVAPWLRGIETEQSQTTVAWRAEVEPIEGEYLTAKALTAIFSKHRIRPHESLTVNTGYLIKEFLEKIPKLKDRPENLLSTRVAVRLPRGQVEWRSLQELKDDPGILYAQPTLILPATFGGLKAGMLDAESISKIRKPDEPPAHSLDKADEPEYEPRKDDRARLRLLIERTEDGWKTLRLPGGVPLPPDLVLESTDGKTKTIFEGFTKAGYRVRLRQDITLDEEDKVIRSLVMLAPIGDAKKKVDQLLIEHVAEVEQYATRIAEALQLDEVDPLRQALQFAAKWHDEGKKAEVWQRYAYGSTDEGKWLGKMAVTRDARTTLKGYRHEFGSSLRLQHPDRCNTSNCTLPTDPATRDLALHLIAAHHGGGRPHFPAAIYRDFEDVADAMQVESIQRFARLQRKYGWWALAWLENLLRCADQLASAETGSEGGEDESEEGVS